MNNTGEFSFSQKDVIKIENDSFDQKRNSLVTRLKNETGGNDETEKLRAEVIRESYQKTPEYKVIQKLIHNNPEKNEKKIIEQIKQARARVALDADIFENTNNSMVSTNFRHIISTHKDHEISLRNRMKGDENVSGLFFENKEPVQTGKVKVYHWAMKSTLPHILKYGLLPGVLSGYGSGSAIFNYATLDLNNDWVGSSIGDKQDGSEFSLLQIEIGGLEILSWEQYKTNSEWLAGGWNSNFISSTALGENGERKMYHRMLRYDQENLTKYPLPETTTRKDVVEDYRYSYRLGDFVSSGFMNSNENKEIMFWYSSPGRIKVVDRKDIPDHYHSKLRRLKKTLF